MIRIDENGANIANKMMFIQSVESILNRAKNHPAIDTIALEKARNAARRALTQEIMTYKKISDSGSCAAAVAHLPPFDLRFKPLA